MILSKRLKAVTDLLPDGNVVADVGCDHGYISISLVESGRYKKAIAMDVRKGPLAIAKENIAKEGLSDRIETRLSDGLAGVNVNEADAAVIAGMGGQLLIGILNRSIDKVREMDYLVLQPQSDINLVREYLRKNNLQILKENMVKDEGKYYPMFIVTYSEDYSAAMEMFRTKVAYDIFDCQNILKIKDVDNKMLQGAYDYYGKELLHCNNEMLLEYLLHEKEVYGSILEKLPESSNKRKEDVEYRLQLINLSLRIMEQAT